MPKHATATIYKYHLAAGEIKIPTAATYLAAHMTPEGPCGWFLVNPDSPTETRRFAIVQTGQLLPGQIEDCPFLATLQWLAPTGNPMAPVKVKIAHVFEIPDHVKLPTVDSGKPPDPADWWKP